MQVREIMTENPTCCGPDASLKDAASLMSNEDCGEIPVVDNQGHPIGVVTDRDISCRGVAQGIGPEAPVREVMSSPAITVTPDTELADCCKTLEDNQIRRAPVVDESGACCGIISQADIAQHAPEHDTAQVVREVSKPTQEASHAGMF